MNLGTAAVLSILAPFGMLFLIIGLAGIYNLSRFLSIKNKTGWCKYSHTCTTAILAIETCPGPDNCVFSGAGGRGKQ
jgi:hypothetical protein